MAEEEESEPADMQDGTDGNDKPSEVGEESRKDSPTVPCHIFLPVVPAARVIGKGGASIRAIREQTGANVRILQKELPIEMQRREDRIVVLTGDAHAVKAAVDAVLERVFDRSGLPDAADRSARERAYVVELLVPEKSGSHLIGQKGERIRTLIEETGCDINVVKEPIPGLSEQKRVRVIANKQEDAVETVWRLQTILGELFVGGVLKQDHFELREMSGTSFSEVSPYASGSFASRRTLEKNNSKEVPVRLLVSKDEAPWIVGKRGNKILHLRDFAKVNMSDADSPPFDESDRVVEIFAAPLQQRLRVVQLITEDLALRPEGFSELRVLVPTEQFGSVMGHRGETIRSIIQRTRAQLQQHKAEKGKDGKDYRFRLIEIKGDIKQHLEVVKQIHTALENRDGGPFESASSTFDKPAEHFDSGYALPSSLSGLGASLAGALAGAGVPGAGTMRSGTVSSAMSLAMDRGASELGQLTLQLAMPNEEVAQKLASDTSGIAWRAGVRLASARGPGGLPVLKVTGTAVGNSVACYLIQDRLFMAH